MYTFIEITHLVITSRHLAITIGKDEEEGA